MKKYGIFLLMLIMLFFVCSCGDEQGVSNVEKVVPIYEGVSFNSHQTYNLKSKQQKKDDKDDVVDEVIKDTIKKNFGVITTEELSYYAVKGEKAYITLNFYNPDQYEILSFVLNGVKYQTFQFTEDSNAEAITVGVTVPEVSGVYEYFVEQVKYIDGNKIEDCKMEGNQSIKIGIGYDVTPNASTNVEVQYNDLIVDTTIVDSSNVVENSDGEFKIFVFDENGVLIDSQTIKLGKNNAHFKNLEINTKYRYVIATSYNAFDGEGPKTDILEEGEILTKSYIELADVVATRDSIAFDVTYEEEDVVVSEVSLSLDGNQVATITDLNASFTELLSGVTYDVCVKYTIGETEYTHKEEISTDSYITPIVNLEVNAAKKEVSYNINIIDEDEIFNLEKVELIKNGNVVAIINSLTDTFSGLLSNTTYVVKVTYSYDLHNGDGTLTETISQEINTKPLSKASYGIDYIVSDDNVSGKLIVVDNDNVSSLISIDLYRSMDSLLINTTNLSEFSFTLASNTTYKLVVNYVYDLNEGEGEVIGSCEVELTSCKEVPSIVIESYNTTTDAVYYDITINDSNSVGHVKSIRLYNDGQYVKDMSPYDTSITDLYSNSNYEIKVVYVYDLDDGLGSREVKYSYEFKTLKNSPEYYITAESDATSITINHNLTDYDGALTYSYTKIYLAGELLEEYEDISKVKFENLLSNTKYRIEVGFVCDINNGEFDYVRSAEVVTESLRTPSVNINTNSTKYAISYTYDVTDADNVMDSASVYLLDSLGNKLDNVATNGIFNSLLSNNEYTVVVCLLCDFNDGKGLIEVLYTSDAKTNSLANPTVDLEFTSAVDSITFTEEVTDNDNIYKFDSIEVYLNDKLIDTVTDITLNTIDELNANTIYTFVINYHYNLNDGNGDIYTSYEESFSTVAHNVEVLSYQILNTLTPKTNEDISIRIDVSNLSKVEIQSVIINGNEYSVVGGNTIDNIIVVANSGNVSGTISLKITQIKYLLNGFILTQEVDAEAMEVEVLSRLNILNVSTLDGNSVYKLNNQYYNFVIKIDNPDGYQVKSIKYIGVGGNEYVDVYMIDNNHITCYIDDNSINNLWEGGMFVVDEIKYVNGDGTLASRKYDQSFKLTEVGLHAEEDTYALVVNYISTPQEFLAMENGQSYELLNDIDMTGYDWKMMDFGGFFDGKGYSIKNITLISEDEYLDHRNIALFNRLTGVFRNVYLENIYINIQTKGSVTFKLLVNNDEAEISNVLISGSASINAIDGYDYLTSFGPEIYGVDGFKVNGENIEFTNLVTSEELTEEYKQNVLGWSFIEREYADYNGLLYYIIDDSYIFIHKYNGTDKIVEIPDEIDGKPVIGISDFAFKDCTTLEEIYLSNNIIYCGGSILTGCYNLKAIYNLTDKVSLTHLFGNVEYKNSYNRDNFSGYFPEKFEKIVFAEGCTEIADYQFAYMISLKEVILPSGLKSIGLESFYKCENLKEIVIPEGVTRIGIKAFFKCSSLTTVTLPSTLTTIEHEAFRYCRGLKEIVIPEGVTNIGIYAFQECSSLTTATLPSTLTTIGFEAFSYCSELKEIIIPEGMTVIEEGTFLDCTKLSEVTLPSTLIEIQYGAFVHCYYLTEIKLPDNLEVIGEQAFMDCTSLSEVYLPSSLKRIEDSAFVNCGLKEVELNDGLEFIGAQAFGYTGIKKIVVPNSVEVIEDGAFCISDLREVVLSSGMDYLDNIFMFAGLYLKSIYLPKSIKAIDEKALEEFSNDSYIFYEGTEEEWNEIDANFDVVVIYEYEYHEKVTTKSATFTLVNGKYMLDFRQIDKSAQKIDFAKEYPNYILKSLNAQAFEGCSVVEINFTEGLEYISSGNFFNTNQLTQLIIPEGVKKVFGGSFAAYALNSIVFPSTVTYIEVNSLEVEELVFKSIVPPTIKDNFLSNNGNMDNLKVYIPKGSLEAYKAIESDTWQALVVAENKLVEKEELLLEVMSKTIRLEDLTVKYDGEVHSLAVSGTLPEGVTLEYVGNDQSEVGVYNVEAIFTIDGTLILTLEAQLLICGDAIYEGDDFTVTLNDNGTATINSYVGDATALMIPGTIIVDDMSYTVTEIAACAFINNQTLETVCIASTIESIGDIAFVSCSSLKKVIILGDCTANFGSDVFSSTCYNNGFTIYVCEEYYEAYANINQFYWQSSFIDILN